MNKFNLEFTLNTAKSIDESLVRNSLVEFGENLSICEIDCSQNYGKVFKVIIKTEDPTIIFDACTQLGRISFVKVDENQ